jgi:hypothetical protein
LQIFNFMQILAQVTNNFQKFSKTRIINLSKNCSSTTIVESSWTYLPPLVYFLMFYLFHVLEDHCQNGNSIIYKKYRLWI